MNHDIVPTSARHPRRHLAHLLLALVAVITLTAPACSSSSNLAAGLAAEEACHQNSDCARGLVCALLACRAMCAGAADCGSGGVCIDSGNVAVCQYVDENNTPCTKESDCPEPLACAADYRCRNLCATTAECNVLGITGRVCARDANGYDYCAIPSEVTNGVITAPPPPGHANVPVMEPADATVGGVGMDGTPGEDSTLGGDGSPGAGSDATTGDSAMGGPDAGTGVVAVCVPGCPQGRVCVEGSSGPTCTPCGTAGLVCCEGQQCGTGLGCAADGTCECGYANLPCCAGNMCSSGLTCNSDDAGGQATCACGEIGTRCCPGVDGGAPSCSTGAACAGTKCTCVVQFAAGGSGSAPGVVLRTDGTVWAAGPPGNATFTQMNGISGPLRASFVAASSPGPSTLVGGSQFTVPIGCAIVGGGVWCFPTGASLSDSTDLGAGLGPTDTTSSPVQVVTPSAGGTPLANVTQLAGGVPESGADFCATTSDGSAWCWGYGGQGQLGNGGTANSSLASQVLANGSTPLANVAEVRLSYEASCARKTDGTVWCWGTNSWGELGRPSGAMPSSYYPVQVAFSGTTAQTTAIGLGAGRTQTFCAIMQDTSVVCWGYNSSGQAGASPADAGIAAGPSRVLVGAGGAALTGIVEIAGDGDYSMCGKTSNLQLLCWGQDSDGTPYPTAYKNSASTAAVGIAKPLSESQSGIGYLDPSGLLVAGGNSSGPQPPCTNLLP